MLFKAYQICKNAFSLYRIPKNMWYTFYISLLCIIENKKDYNTKYKIIFMFNLVSCVKTKLWPFINNNVMVSI